MDGMATNQHIGTGGAVLSLRQISKQYAGVTVLSGVDLDLYAGEALGLAGQNGAGKSTLVKIICGDERPSSGDMYVLGERVHFKSSSEAQRIGIATIHQEISLIPRLTVAENLCLSNLPTRLHLVDRGQLVREAHDSISALGFAIDVRVPAGSLSVAQQQVVLIAKALRQEARILLLDEPTAALSVPDAEKLFELLMNLKREGATLLYISHRLDEMYRVCERVMVLRDGLTISMNQVGAISRHEVVRQMIGAAKARDSITSNERRIGSSVGSDIAPVLEARSLGDGGLLKDVSISVRPGESVAVTGLVGSGPTELVSCLFGERDFTTGEVVIHGRAMKSASPRKMVAAGVGWVPDDRKTQGLILNMDLGENATLANLPLIAPRGLLERSIEARIGEGLIRTLGIKTLGVRQRTGRLSGGNQQKVVIGKWLTAGVRILLMSEPTRGIDVGAREDIYREIHEFVADGGTVIMALSEMEEALMCDRLYVISHGRVVGHFEHGTATIEQIMELVS